MRESTPLKKVGLTVFPKSSHYCYCYLHDSMFSYSDYNENEKQHIVLESYGSVLLHML